MPTNNSKKRKANEMLEELPPDLPDLIDMSPSDLTKTKYTLRRNAGSVEAYSGGSRWYGFIIRTYFSSWQKRIEP